MIRFLQKDSRVVKAIFVAIIAVAAVTMVIALVPGIFQDATVGNTNYATIHSRRFFGSTTDVTVPEIQQIATRILQQQHLPDMAMPYVLPQAAQVVIQRDLLVMEANRLGLRATDADLRRELQTGPFSRALYPQGKFIGDDRYADLVQNYFHTSVADFESQVKKEIELNRLESMVTAGITVSDQEAKNVYREQGTKIKFEYAVINSEDLNSQINPTDAELQKFFSENKSRYATAVPEARQIQYFTFSENQVPGGVAPVTDAEVAQYYSQHQKDYQVPEGVKVRHILIKVAPDADAKTDAAAKKKAEDILAQLKKGANFAELAKKYSDDPGSKEQGGELGMIQRGVTVPPFEKAAFSLQPGQLSDIVKTQFGYHIIEVEAKQEAHDKSLAEVKGEIVPVLTRQKEAEKEAAYAQQLAAAATKDGLAKTASEHHLQLVTTGDLQQNALVPGLADGSKLLGLAFNAQKGAPAQIASTGDGYAVFEVTKIDPAHAPTFAQYKSQLLDDFRQQQLPQLLARKVNELASKAQSENNLEQAAKEVGAKIETSDLVSGTSQVPDIGQLQQVAPDIFNLNTGQISKAINTGHSGLVVKILDKQEPNDQEIAKNLDATRQKLLSDRRDQMFSVFVSDLMQRYEKRGLIHVNKEAQLTQGLPS